MIPSNAKPGEYLKKKTSKTFLVGFDDHEKDEKTKILKGYVTAEVFPMIQ